MLRPLFDHAQRAHRVLPVDLRGFGESDAPGQPYTIAGYTDDLAFLIDRFIQTALSSAPRSAP